ncbi:MAG: glycine hydroxymethyltransferase [Chlamydiales bacterium]|nr:glycine hydroxymethyltransferase [Chlamydiales bacterium]
MNWVLAIASIPVPRFALILNSLIDNFQTSTQNAPMTSAASAYKAVLEHLKVAAPTIAKSILNELYDQRNFLKLIASENYSSLTVQLAMGNLLTDKYSEGFPFHRFYAGCENVDAIESEAATLAQELFNMPHAYVQPHSGADANLVAFWAILTQRVQEPAVQRLSKKSIDELSPEEFEEVRKELCNQTVMGLSLASGGHLTHGYRHNISAKMMRAVTYDTNPKTGLLDYDQIAEIAKRERPLILMAGYSAYPRRINFAKMRSIANDVGAVLMVDMAHFSGLVAGKVFQGEESPAGYADLVTSTTHKTLRGPRGGIVLSSEEFAPAVDKGCPLVLGGPLPHVMAAKAIAFREALSKDFQKYAHKVVENARALAEGFLKRGIKVVTGGTDNHLVLIDIADLGITGRQAELGLREAGLTVNRNMVPFDPNGPWYTSGVRLGPPALTTRGMGTSEMDEIADILSETLKNMKPMIVEKTGAPSRAKYKIDEKVLLKSRSRVQTLLDKYPLYAELEV